MGSKCCWCCCDTRRAVIICNAISIVLTFLSIIFVSVGVGVNGVVEENDDDAYDNRKDFSFTAKGITLGGVIALQLLAIVCHVVGIFGALKYNVWAVAFSFLWYVASLVLNGINLNILGLILALGFIYPHLELMIEIQRGIMSEKTYEDQEMYSCCC
eukprot:CAMPEP_0119012966 /NCGR_PEP_ID=MMETSP1176-20130426/7724_1 /TAXON_ID=265551 /ORGANISM="Synedropsis recta cf, Strain CCMP1620" /LENGTH=156 /DNA_ID=CAMNT_0006966007 /DNA_START=342 /DNA_END=812 /DNA_ORIENTATION=+